MIGAAARSISRPWPTLIERIMLGSRIPRWRVDSLMLRPPPDWCEIDTS